MKHFEEEHGENSKHAGTGLYKEAERILGLEQSTLWKFKSLADQFEFCRRRQNLTWAHHYEVASLKKTYRPATGKWKVSDEPDTDKMQELLKKAEAENLSVRALREVVASHKQRQAEEIRLANLTEKVYPWSSEFLCGAHYASQGETGNKWRKGNRRNPVRGVS